MAIIRKDKMGAVVLTDEQKKRLAERIAKRKKVERRKGEN